MLRTHAEAIFQAREADILPVFAATKQPWTYNPSDSLSAARVLYVFAQIEFSVGTVENTEVLRGDLIASNARLFNDFDSPERIFADHK